MIGDALSHINLWAAAVAAVAYFALGAAWFTPLFGRAWDRSIGHDRAASSGRFPVSYYVVPLVTAVITTLMIILLGAALGGGLVRFVLTGVAVGVAIASATVTNALTPHTPRPYLFATVTGGYHLAASILVGIIMGLL